MPRYVGETLRGQQKQQIGANVQVRGPYINFFPQKEIILYVAVVVFVGVVNPFEVTRAGIFLITQGDTQYKNCELCGPKNSRDESSVKSGFLV